MLTEVPLRLFLLYDYSHFLLSLAIVADRRVSAESFDILPLLVNEAMLRPGAFSKAIKLSTLPFLASLKFTNLVTVYVLTLRLSTIN